MFTSDLGAQTAAQQAALRQLAQNPEAVRQRILASGLSESEIRSRLTAAGLPASALDPFLGPSVPAPGTIDLNALDALRTLQILVETPDGLEFVAMSTGMGFRAARPDSVGLQIFGLDVFTRGTSQFQPLLYGPVPDDYRLGPGDTMVLVLTGEVELAHELIVTRAGFIVIPDVGQIQVANLSLLDLRALLRRRLGVAYSGIERGSTTFDVTVTQLRTIQVYVSGEVTQAAAYQLSSVATVMNALYAAGGPTELGGLRSVEVRRRAGGQVTLDLYPYLLRGDVSGDVRLEQGDVVFVPLRGRRVQVHGAMVRPAEYELDDDDDLLDVFTAAGGFAPDADRRRVTIHRVARPSDVGPGVSDRVAIDLGLAASSDPGVARHVGGVVIPPVGLQDGDSIVVGQAPSLLQSYHVTIGGMVTVPDTFPWREGMTLRDLVLLARGPIVGADLRAAEVSRLPRDRSTGQLAELIRVPLDSSYLSQRDVQGRYTGAPGLPFAAPGTSPEFVLDPFDQVVILRQPDFEMPQTVKVTGEVPVPGEYTLTSKSDHVTDLIGRAGGMLGTAYPEGARLLRRQDELGRIDIDLPAALADPTGRNNVVLQPGDSLHIPVYSPTVVVQGAVNSPVTVLYRQGEGLEYYIANAGGYRNDADRGRLSVRFANGQAETRSRFLFWSSYPAPGPGSVVSVPAEDPTDRLDTRGLIADLVAILGSVATVIVVLTR